jgi:hypothetical protein
MEHGEWEHLTLSSMAKGNVARGSPQHKQYGTWQAGTFDKMEHGKMESLKLWNMARGNLFNMEQGKGGPSTIWNMARVNH